VLLLLVFAIPEMRWAITSLSRRKKTAPTKTMIFDASRLAVESVPVLAIPWIYVILCAAIAPKYGIVAGSHCSGYEVPAKGGKLVLYDPVQPESANTFKEEDVAETRGPRADAFAGFLAEALDPSNLRVYRPCVLPVAKR
jgi:hypothetical protein